MAGVVVVGAGPGLGAAVACRFAREGLPVGLIARGRATLRAARRAVGRQALEVSAYLADVADDRALRFALDGVIAQFGVPDALVYNASPGSAYRVGELSRVDVAKSWDVSIAGAMGAAAAVLPLMVEQGRGTVLLTGGSPKGLPGTGSLSPGNSGLRVLAEILAAGYGSAGVHVASVMIKGRVAPGTEFDPEEIADYHWRIHREQWERWRPHYDYTGTEDDDEAGFAAGECTDVPWGNRLSPCR